MAGRPDARSAHRRGNGTRSRGCLRAAPARRLRDGQFRNSGTDAQRTPPWRLEETRNQSVHRWAYRPARLPRYRSLMNRELKPDSRDDFPTVQLDALHHRGVTQRAAAVLEIEA